MLLDTGSRVFKEKYPEISQSKALIIDLRNNGGGSSDWQILRYLIREPQLVHKMYTRQYTASFRAWGRLQDTWGNSNGIAPVKDQLFSKPVILLISARTFSAAEDFAAAFKSLNRGLIMGNLRGQHRSAFRISTARRIKRACLHQKRPISRWERFCWERNCT
ncbi:S41 family peptidase [Niabella sp. W65]|nr:S41 family peptidase [Niabella sp. W65]MCH7369172.1 S41 family peptidase [Niabella sp. W65]